MAVSRGLSPLVSLATSMHSQPGVYAVLLGSGVSTGAGLLTGWGVVTELGVLPTDVVDAVDGCSASDAGVGSMVIVVVQPGVVAGGSLLV